MRVLASPITKGGFSIKPVFMIGVQEVPPTLYRLTRRRPSVVGGSQLTRL